MFIWIYQNDNHLPRCIVLDSENINMPCNASAFSEFASGKKKNNNNLVTTGYKSLLVQSTI